MRLILAATLTVLTSSALAEEVDILFLGEVHDNPAHHVLQAEEIIAFNPAAVVFEMLDADQAARVRPPLLTNPSALSDVIDWEASGWPDIQLYAPVFAASETAAIYGAHLHRGLFMDALRNGASAVFAGDPARFGLDEPLPEDQQTVRNQLQHDAHCGALPVQVLPQMVEVQRLRDGELARVAALAFAETGGPVAVILGNGHARTDWGAPALLALAAPDLTFRSVAHLEADPEDGAPYDAWRVTEAIERGDPCAAFN